jgi:hypothetical protein
MRRGLIVVVVLVVAGLAYLGLKRETSPSAPAPAGVVRLEQEAWIHRAIGRVPEGFPWITDLAVADLDGDGWNDVLVCDGRLNKVSWIRQVRRAVFEEQDIGGPVAGPAHVEVVDLNGDGHRDVLVAGMGTIPPSNARTGSVVVLMNDGANRFTNRVLLENIPRVTYVFAADLNGDRRLDVVVGAFGYLSGEIRWLENDGAGGFKSHALLDLPGTIHSPVADVDGDGNLDVVALVSQDAEEVHAFIGDGRGGFRNRVLYGSTNRDYGSSGLTVADVNRDGRPDIVYTNGDGFDYATPGSRPWHGVQWLENMGGQEFAFHRIGDFAGAFSPVVVDLNRDGHADVVACSGFNDWNRPDAVSLMCFENDGTNRFIPRVLALQPTHLVVVRAADMFNDGRIQLVTGAMMFYPPFDRVSRVTLWEPRK